MFEPVSKVSRIDALAFYDCSSLKSICVPRAIAVNHLWDEKSALQQVIYEPSQDFIDEPD
jgi:hypothetical protein